MSKYFLLTVTAFAFSSAVAQTNLEPAEVEAFRLNSPEKLVTGAVHTVDSAVIKSHGSSDLSRALNAIPGVKMETRGEGGSRRIHVRGSSLRSPYSIRNSMLLIDGFIFTEADGNSPVEWLDPEIISGINVVTGPAAASYGGAYGGAIIAESNDPARIGNSANCQYRISTTGRTEDHSINHPNYRLAGNIGLQSRLAYSSQFSSDDFTYSLSIISTENPGYRDWEWNMKDQLYFKASTIDQNDGTHSLVAGLFSGAWALPGALKEEIADSTPLTSPGLTYNAHVNRERYLVGYRFDKTTNSGLELKASILGRYTNKVNPYGTSAGYFGHKEENGQGLSALASVLKTKNINEDWDFKAELSLMHLRDNYDLAEWDYDPSQLVIPQRYDLAFDVGQTFASTSLIITNNNNLRLEAQIGVNHRNRLTEGIVFIEDTTTFILQPNNYNVPKAHTTLLPRLGLSYMPTENISLFGQISTGFSDPTAFELVDNETLFPAELESESALGQEIGFKLYLNNSFEIKATAYNQKVDNAIMQVNQAFKNVEGGLSMKGFEFDATWSNENIWVRGFATLTNHKFGESSELSGNTIPGAPTITGGLQARVNTQKISLYSDFRHVGVTEILNDNSVQTAPYSVIDLSVECQLFYDLTIEFGCRNLLNAEYSNWPQINDEHGKLYNPAPPRTGFISIRRPI